MTNKVTQIESTPDKSVSPIFLKVAFSRLTTELFGLQKAATTDLHLAVISHHHADHQNQFLPYFVVDVGWG